MAGKKRKPLSKPRLAYNEELKEDYFEAKGKKLRKKKFQDEDNLGHFGLGPQ